MPRKAKKQEVKEEPEPVKEEPVKKKSNWIDEVKAVQKRDGISYKEAMTVASKERKSKE